MFDYPSVRAQEIYIEQMFKKPAYYHAAQAAAKKRQKCKVQFMGRCIVR